MLCDAEYAHSNAQKKVTEIEKDFAIRETNSKGAI